MFPSVEQASPHGVVMVGGPINADVLQAAYRQGIFPWPHDDLTLWFAPPRRAILLFHNFHVPRRLARSLRAHPFDITFNSQLPAVIARCAERDEGTWITPELEAAYLELAARGEVLSVEAWRQGELVGGLYGVLIGRYFCGESMFSRTTNASKAALVALVDYLRTGGATWLDVQMRNRHLSQFGVQTISRRLFTTLLEEAQAETLLIPAVTGEPLKK